MITKEMVKCILLILLLILLLGIFIIQVVGLLVSTPSSASTTPSSASTPILVNVSHPNSTTIYTGSPALTQPFIFFHQRKSGGSKIRDEIMAAAKAIEAPTFIPCVTPNLGCETYYTPENGDFPPPIPTVYGGHIHYNTFIQTLYVLHNVPKLKVQISPPPPKFTCFTIFREPISRIQSCWNYRFIQTNPVKKSREQIHKLADMPTTNLTSQLTSARSKYGKGCLNEPMRIFSDFGQDEPIVNNLAGADLGIAELALNQTVERAGQCVVGILERCADTKLVIEKHLPFFAPYFSCDHQENTGKVEKGALSDDHLAILQELGRFEIRAYEQANLLLDAQIM